MSLPTKPGKVMEYFDYASLAFGPAEVWVTIPTLEAIQVATTINEGTSYVRTMAGKVINV